MSKTVPKTKKRCSLRDVAKVADLSVTTVHRILTDQNSRFISENTKERVKKIAEDLGWRQNVGYKMMHGDTIRCIGVVMSTPQLRQREPFNELLIEVVDTMNRRGFAANIIILGYDKEENLKRIREQLAHGVESFIMLGDPIGYTEIEVEIKKAGCPLIGMGYRYSRRIISYPGEARIELISRFINAGFKKLRYVMHSEASDIEHQEAELLKKIYSAPEADEILNNLFYTDIKPSFQTDILTDDYQAGRKIAACMLEQCPDVQSVIFPSDAAALGGAAEFMAHGKIIGKDLVIAGFYNSAASRMSLLPVSSIGFNIQEICKQLTDRAFDDEPCCLQIPAIPFCRLN